MTDAELTQNEKLKLTNHSFVVAKRLLIADRDYRLEGNSPQDTKIVAAAVLWNPYSLKELTEGATRSPDATSLPWLDNRTLTFLTSAQARALADQVGAFEDHVYRVLNKVKDAIHGTANAAPTITTLEQVESAPWPK